MDAKEMKGALAAYEALAQQKATVHMGNIVHAEFGGEEGAAVVTRVDQKRLGEVDLVMVTGLQVDSVAHRRGLRGTRGWHFYWECEDPTASFGVQVKPLKPSRRKRK